jgi:hypothetical protein
MATSRPFPAVIALDNSVTNIDETIDYVTLGGISREQSAVCAQTGWPTSATTLSWQLSLPESLQVRIH